ncbi:unnamed protein product, partial [Tuber aestivum]
RQNIPEDLLNQSGLGGADDPIEFRQAIGKLLGFSLVTTVKTQDKTFYELHRLVQLSLQVYLPTEELKRWRATALGVVSRHFPCHWNTVSNLASVLQSQGKYDESEAMNRRALDGCVNILGHDHPYTLTHVNNLAGVLQGQGKYKESEAM